MFNVYPVTNVGTGTYKKLTGLSLEQDGQYYVWVMGMNQLSVPLLFLKHDIFSAHLSDTFSNTQDLPVTSENIVRNEGIA